MVILGTPQSNLENYYMADGEIAFILHQKGFAPMYKDGEVLYFKLTSKLRKMLEKLNIEF